MSDLLRDAEDEIRRETIEGGAKKAVPFLIGAIVLALVGGGVWQLWQNQQDKAREAASTQYYAAMDKLKSGDLDGGIAALDAISKNAPKGFATLAAIQKADVLQEKGESANAMAAFDAAANIATDPDLKQLAQLRAAYIAADLETREKLNARLEPIIKSKSPLSALASELRAATAWAAKDYKAAKDDYALLQSSPLAPEGVRQRAGQALAVINSQAELANDLMEVPQAPQGADGQGAPTPEQLAAMQKAMAAQQAQAGAQPAPAPQAAPQNVERDAQGKRIVRLPPGVKLPPNAKIPPDVHVIETPLPAAEVQKLQQKQAAAEAQAKAQMQKQIEAERAKAMANEKSVTQSQQEKVDAIANQTGAPKN